MSFQLPSIPEPPVPPTPAQAPTGVIAGGQTYNPQLARRTLEGAQAKRSELRNQQDRLEDKRQDLQNELTGDNAEGATMRSGIEARIKDIDARIKDLDAQIAQADLAVANAAEIPGATTEEPRPPRNGPPEDVFVVVPVMLILCVMLPLTIAYARRLWKKGATVIAPVPKEVQDRLNQLGDAVDSIAIEVERIGEGQRFVTKVMSEGSRALGVGAAQPVPVPQAQGERLGARPGS